MPIKNPRREAPRVACTVGRRCFLEGDGTCTHRFECPGGGLRCATRGRCRSAHSLPQEVSAWRNLITLFRSVNNLVRFFFGPGGAPWRRVACRGGDDRRRAAPDIASMQTCERLIARRSAACSACGEVLYNTKFRSGSLPYRRSAAPDVACLAANRPAEKSPRLRAAQADLRRTARNNPDRGRRPDRVARACAGRVEVEMPLSSATKNPRRCRCGFRPETISLRQRSALARASTNVSRSSALLVSVVHTSSASSRSG